MKVDTAHLRAVADRLVEQAGQPLEQAGHIVAQAEGDVSIATMFDDCATAGPYREASASWQAQITVLRQAVGELAAAIRESADGYDHSDATAETRLDPR